MSVNGSGIGAVFAHNREFKRITLVMRDRYPKERKPLYCINCGSLLEFTYKDVMMVIQGTAAPDKVMSEGQCRKCKVIYEVC